MAASSLERVCRHWRQTALTCTYGNCRKRRGPRGTTLFRPNAPPLVGPTWAVAAGAAAGRRAISRACIRRGPRTMATRDGEASRRVGPRVRGQGAAQGMVARAAGHRDAAPRGVGRQQGFASEFAAGAVGQRAGAAVLRGDAEARRRRACRRLIAEQGPLAVPLALWIARQVAEGLDALLRSRPA